MLNEQNAMSNLERHLSRREPPPGLEQLPGIPLNEPTHRERLQAETDVFGFVVSAQRCHESALMMDVI